MLQNSKNIIKAILCTSLFVGLSKADFEIQESVFVPNNLGKLSLFHNKKGFKVFEESGVKHKVGNHNIDTILHKMDSDQLNKFLVYGYLALKKNDAGEYIIKAKVRGNGGGPIGATVGAMAGGAVVQATYGAALGGIGLALTPFLTPAGAAGVVGTIHFFTYPVALVATKTAMIAGGIAGGVATGPI